MDLTYLPLAFAAGFGMGLIYFAILWVSTRRLPRARHPMLWFFATSALRILLLMAGFLWISGGAWDSLLGCLLGFLVARFAATAMAKAFGANRSLSS